MASKNFSMVILLGLLVALVGCPTDSTSSTGNTDNTNNTTPDDNTVTFALDKIDSNSFTLTINGASWNKSSSENPLKMLIFDGMKCNQITHTFNGNIYSLGVDVQRTCFTFDIDEKIITVKLTTSGSGYSYYNLTGTLSLTDESINNYMKTITSSNIIHSNNVYKVAAGKDSITF